LAGSAAGLDNQIKATKHLTIDVDLGVFQPHTDRHFGKQSLIGNQQLDAVLIQLVDQQALRLALQSEGQFSGMLGTMETAAS